METTDLVELEELKRRLLEPISARVSAPTNPDGPDAVAAITALQARVEKLEGENTRLHLHINDALHWIARGQVDRAESILRAALAEDYCGIVEVNEEDFKAEGERG